MITKLTFCLGHSRSKRPSARVLSALGAICAVVLAVTALSALEREGRDSNDFSNPIVSSPVEGRFTGEFDAGAPVYRLPPVEVIGHRTEESARRVGAMRPAVLM